MLSCIKRTMYVDDGASVILSRLHDRPMKHTWRSGQV